MSNDKLNVGCGGAVAIFIGLMLVIAALVYASNHMYALTNFIVGATIFVLIIVIMVQRK